MTRPIVDMQRALALRAKGLATAEVARRTGLPRSTIRYWIDNDMSSYRDRSSHAHGDLCPHLAGLASGPYAYLLGLYLGDGCLSRVARDVYTLRIVLDAKYPGISECGSAAALVLPNKVGHLVRTGCIEVYSHSKHWLCLFPQHGSGPKHQRPIALVGWQEDVALDRHPYLLLRGLIQSDGWRGVNRVGRFEYPRYLFSNRSADIRQLLGTACARMGIASRPSGRWQVAVSRREDVARMDLFVGKKR